MKKPKQHKSDSAPFKPAVPAIIAAQVGGVHPTLDDLVAGITPGNRHEEVDWGKPKGDEVW